MVDLARYDEGFEKAETKADEFSVIPNGKYVCNVDKVQIKEVSKGKYAGEGMLSWQLRIEGGDYDNRILFLNNLFVSKELDPGLAFVGRLKQTLKKAGLQIAKLSELETRIGELLDRKLNVTVKNTVKDGKEYSNIYVDSVAEAGDAGGDCPF